MTRSTLRASLLLALALVVPACGGGGSGGGAGPSGPAILVVLTSAATTSEDGGVATFTVALSTLPTADVDIDVSSDNTSEGSLGAGPLTLTFTSTNGTTPQTVTVTGVDDSDLDGAVNYNIVLAPADSTDAAYDNLDAADVALSNADNEVIGVSVTPTALGDIGEGGQATFTVALTSPPTGDVSIPITVTTGVGDVTVSGFGSGGEQTTFNLILNAVQPSRNVTVRATDDSTVELTEAFVVTVGDPTSATDAGYDALPAVGTVTGNVLDNDALSIVVTPATTSGGPTLMTSELGSADTFQVRLGAGISLGGQVTVTITGLDATEGTLSTTTVVFNDTNAQTFQTVTVTGIDDAADDAADVEYTLTLTASNTGINPADDNWNTVLPAAVVVTNVDTEAYGAFPPGTTLVTTPTATPGIQLGAGGAFMSFEATDPAVLMGGASGSTFEMFFRGRSQSGTKTDGIGRARSNSAASGWFDFGQVLFPNAGVDWIRRGVGRPSVLRADFNQSGDGFDTYMMFYSGRFAGHYDGIDWVTSGNGVSDPSIFGGYGTPGSWSGPVSTPRFQATGVAGDWDEIQVADPCVILVGTTFHMWYTGFAVAEADGGIPQIGYATAPLVGGQPGAWTRQNLLAVPALAAGAANKFDGGGVSQPAVVVEPGPIYRMYFTAHDALRGRKTIGYAESSNPAAFTAGKFPLPIILPDASGTATWADQNVFSPAVVKDVATYRIWYSGTGSGGSGIGYLESN